MKEMESHVTTIGAVLDELIRDHALQTPLNEADFPDEYRGLIDRVNELGAEVAELDRALTDQALEHLDGDWASAGSRQVGQILGIIDRMSLMVFQVAGDGAVVSANQKAKAFFKSRGLKGLPYDSADAHGALMSYLCSFRHADEGAKYPVLFEVRDYDRDAWYKITTDRITLSDGTEGFMHAVEDISDLKRNESQIRLSVMIDSLTGAYSRFAGMQKLDEILRESSLNQINCVAFMDLDGLQEINAQYGHGAGDQALCDMATVLRRSVRETDWVVRYGGDEFLLFLLDCELESTEHVFNRMYKSLEHVNKTGGKPYQLSFSQGVIVIGPNETDVNAVIGQAEAKMLENRGKKG